MVLDPLIHALECILHADLHEQVHNVDQQAVDLQALRRHLAVESSNANHRQTPPLLADVLLGLPLLAPGQLVVEAKLEEVLELGELLGRGLAELDQHQEQLDDLVVGGLARALLPVLHPVPGGRVVGGVLLVIVDAAFRCRVPGVELVVPQQVLGDPRPNVIVRLGQILEQVVEGVGFFSVARAHEALLYGDSCGVLTTLVP